MEVALGIVACLVLGGLLLFEEADRSRERREWAVERQNLLERIQRPEYVPRSLVADDFDTEAQNGAPPPDPDADQLGLVGTVQAAPGEELDG